MCLRACDVLGIELAVEADGGVDLLHDLGRPQRVATSPHRVGVRLLLCILPCHESGLWHIPFNISSAEASLPERLPRSQALRWLMLALSWLRARWPSSSSSS